MHTAATNNEACGLNAGENGAAELGRPCAAAPGSCSRSPERGGAAPGAMLPDRVVAACAGPWEGAWGWVRDFLARSWGLGGGVRRLGAGAGEQRALEGVRAARLQGRKAEGGWCGMVVLFEAGGRAWANGRGCAWARV